MKNILRNAFLALSGLVSTGSFASEIQPGDQLPAGYYLVVAAYRPGQDDYAQKFADKINQAGQHATFGLDAARKYIYVYLARFSDFRESIREMEKTRKSSGFLDAWIRVMPALSLGEASGTSEPQVEKKEEEKPAATVYLAIPKSQVEEKKQESVAPLPAEEPKSNEIVSNAVAVVIEGPKSESVRSPKTLANTPIFLSLVHSRNNRIIESDIEVIDTERSRLITKVKGNSYITLPDPKSKSGQLTLVCNAFGYRKVQHEINFKNTEADTLKPYVILADSFYMVKFDLIRLHKGDISTLYNVYFYNDAAIMLPESTFELNSLLQMLQDNPNYKITLHGHTNGNAHGKIIKIGPSKNFFALTDDVKNGIGSAKDLSRERAQVIKDWLVSQGIGPDRMVIKAWGGGRMIHDKESVHAKKNIRVEVEVIAE